MKSLNRVMLLGNLASDVDFKQTKGGSLVANFPIATNRFIKSSSGEKESRADFHRVTAWGKLGEICHKYLAKGTAVFLEGKIINNNYEDSEGVKRYRSEIVAEDINILSWKKGKTGSNELGLESIKDEKK